MSKAILIMDMPSSCDQCPLCDYVGDCVVADRIATVYERPTWCPLRECPQKNEHYYASDYQDGFASGWNKCIDEILGGNENE